MSSTVVEMILKADDRASSKISGVARSTSQAADATSKLEKGASAAGGSMMKMAGAADLVDPKLGGLLRNLGDVADVAEVATGGAKSLGLSMSSLGIIAAPVAVAVAALAVVYHQLSTELAAAEAAQAKWAETSAAAQKRSEALASIETELATAFRATQGTVAQAQDKLEQRTLAIESAIKAEIAAIGASGESAEAAGERFDSLVEKKQRLLAEAARLYEADLKGTKGSESRAAAATKQTDAYKQMTDAYTRWLAVYNQAQTDERGVAAAQAGMSYLEARVAREAEATAAAEAQAGFAEKAAADWERALRYKRDLDLQKAANVTAIAASPQGAMGAFSNMGPIGQIVTMVVDVVANTDDFVANWYQFIEDLTEGIATLPEKLIQGITGPDSHKLVDPLIAAIPRMVQSLADNVGTLIEAAAKSIPENVVGLVQMLIVEMPRVMSSLIAALLDVDMWAEAGRLMLEGFAEGFTDLWRDLMADLTGQTKAAGNWAETAGANVTGWGAQAGKDIDRAFADLAATVSGERAHANGASYISRGGLHVLGTGESVNSASRTNAAAVQASGMSGRGVMRGAGGKIYIEIDADSLADTFAHHRSRGLAL